MTSVLKLLDQYLRELFAADAASVVADGLEGIVQAFLLLLVGCLLTLLLQLGTALLDGLAAASLARCRSLSAGTIVHHADSPTARARFATPPIYNCGSIEV